jgi:excisionase family DNA binding protein
MEKHTMSQKASLSQDSKAGPVSDLQLLTVAQVAAILDLSKVKVYALLKQRPNRLPSVKIDGARRIQRKKLETWIEQHCEQA